MEGLIGRIRRYEQLEEHEIESICNAVIDSMVLEPNVRRVEPPVVVVGDIHGQFADLLTLLRIEGPPGKASYIFMGDYVDRGDHSLETVLLLLSYKALHPEHVTLLRGNHEQPGINSVYGFYDECMQRYQTTRVWEMINEVFAYFNVAAIVGNRYLCIHGGISGRATINKLERLDRFEKIAEDGLYADVIWSDPFYKPGEITNPRGSGVLFGEDILKRFLMCNELEMLIRSHQLAIEGYKWDFGNLCLTVWSAPDYMSKCSNPGSILLVEKDVPITSNSLKLFKKTKNAGKGKVPNSSTL